jgi:hypothetical protein
MAGYSSTSHITIDSVTVASTMAITFHVHVNSLHDETPDAVANRIDSMSDAEITDMIAMVIGPCSYTVTVAGMDREDAGNAYAAKASRTLLAVLATAVAAAWAQ